MKPFVVLDAMGVIYQASDDVAELLVPFVRAHGGAPDAALIETAYLEASLGRLSPDALWHRLGLDPELEHDYLAAHSLMPGVSAMIRSLYDAGFALWCFTNDVARWSETLRRDHGIERFFEGLVVSSDIGTRKPDAAAYRALLSRLGCAPAEVIFVDDRNANVRAAQALGIEAMRFDRDRGYDPLRRRLGVC